MKNIFLDEEENWKYKKMCRRLQKQQALVVMEQWDFNGNSRAVEQTKLKLALLLIS